MPTKLLDSKNRHYFNINLTSFLKHVHTALLNFMHITECLCPLYCLVQSPNSVTQHFAELSADPVYINRLTTCIQIMALLCPSIVCNRQLSRVSKQSAFKNLVGRYKSVFQVAYLHGINIFLIPKEGEEGIFQHFFFQLNFLCSKKFISHNFFVHY